MALSGVKNEHWNDKYLKDRKKREGIIVINKERTQKPKPKRGHAKDDQA